MSGLQFEPEKIPLGVAEDLDEQPVRNGGEKMDGNLRLFMRAIAMFIVEAVPAMRRH